MKKIYIAGAYNANNVLSVLQNMRKGIRLGTEVLLAGYSPFIPWLDYNVFLQLRENELISLDAIQSHSMEWLIVSDAVLLVPGWDNSKGTEAEIVKAAELKIPIFTSLGSMKEYFEIMEEEE